MDLHDIYDGKTVLVTGASGLIGSNLVERLLLQPRIRVIALGRSSARLERALSPYLGDSRLQLLEHDINDPLPEGLGPVACIFHAGSSASGKVVRDDPMSVIGANLRGAATALDYLRAQVAAGGPTGSFAVFSSATVYGSPAVRDVRVDESATTCAEPLDDPHVVYSESKRMVEVIACAAARQYGIPVTIARFGYVYGWCRNLPQTAFYDFLARAVQGEDIVFSGSGLCRRDNIHVDDAVTGLLHACEYGESGIAYNVSANGELGNFAALDEMADVLADVANVGGARHVRVVAGRDMPRQPGLLMDNARLKALGWRVKVSLEEGVRRTFERVATSELMI